jgi:hypothetical protein
MRSAFMFECLPWLGPMPTVEKRFSSSMLSKPSCTAFSKSLSCRSSSKSTKFLPSGCATMGHGCDWGDLGFGGHTPRPDRKPAAAALPARVPSFMRDSRRCTPLTRPQANTPSGSCVRHELLHAVSKRMRVPAWYSRLAAGAQPCSSRCRRRRCVALSEHGLAAACPCDDTWPPAHARVGMAFDDCVPAGFDAGRARTARFGSAARGAQIDHGGDATPGAAGRARPDSRRRWPPAPRPTGRLHAVAVDQALRPRPA